MQDFNSKDLYIFFCTDFYFKFVTRGILMSNLEAKNVHVLKSYLYSLKKSIFITLI
jgi:hypothetical protein